MPKLKVKTPAQMKAEMAVGRARTVLPQVEREANKAKMLEDSKLPLGYHGTGDDFSEFKYDPQKSLGVWLAKNPELASEYSEYAVRSGKNPSVMPLHTSLKNPATQADLDNATRLAESEPNRSWASINQRRREILQEQGFDGVDVGDTYVVFDPAKIKSAIGNEGTYDITNPDITKAHGGAVHMAKGGKLPKASSPTIMTRSGISELADYIKNREGTYGLRRVERAADEIPKLGELYSPDALRSAFSGDNARALMTIKPSEFENFAVPLPEAAITKSGMYRNFYEGSHDDYIKELAEIIKSGGYNDVPFLEVNKTEQGLPLVPFVSGHEGRHRNRAMDASGEQAGLVQFLPRSELREPFPRRSQEEYIEALKREMSITGNKVLPQTWREPSATSFEDITIRRPAIDLPDLYAEGGAVHMADGGTVKPPPIFEQAQVPFEEVRRQLGMKDGGDAGSGIDINRLYSPFSVLEKPSYGSEIPGTPTIDQQRYELTARGQQEAENRARRNMDSLSSVDPAGTLGVSDVLTTLGKGIVAAPAYIAGNIYDWLRNNKVSDEGAKARGQAIEEWMQPKTQEGAEFLETLGEIPEKITGATMGFGLHPNLWVTGAGMPTPAQMRAGLRLGAERAAPIAGKIDQAVRSGYESGAIPQPGMSIKDVTPRVLAPANEQGFYSPTEAAALNLQRKSGSGQAFLNDLLKQENVRPDEINAMGLDTFLKDKKNITAAEVQDYIAKNKIQLGEAVYGGAPKITPEQKARLQQIETRRAGTPEEHTAQLGEGWYDEMLQLQNIRDRSTVNDLRDKVSLFTNNAERYRKIGNQNTDKLAEQQQYKADYYADRLKALESSGMAAKAPKYKGYSLPGGENYREVVITMPPKELRSPEQLEYAQLQKKMRSGDYSQEDSARFWKLNDELGTEKATEAVFGKRGETYKSSHWDEKNPLAHIRLSDRVTDGKKTLLVDEVQSDWHQAGREKGYKNDIDMPAMSADELLLEHGDRLSDGQKSDLKDFINRWEKASEKNDTEKLDRLFEEYDSWAKRQKLQGVPDAPYKEDWYQLALKRAIKEAIDNGYDRVALPTGARVAERFDLSRQIDRIDYNKNNDGTYSMSAIKGGKQVFSKEGLDENELSNLVGKDVAKKIVGDEGKAQYDVELADELGVGVVKSLTGLDLKVGGEGMKKYYDEIYPGYLKKFGKKYGASVGKTTVDIDGVAEPLHYMEITPAMREAFKTGIHMKRGGKVSFANDIDAMRLALSKG